MRYNAGLTMTNLISVIVPIYDVDKYLTCCLGSIMSQTYQNTEIILVDDGSTDNSGVFSDDLAVNNSNGVSIHKTNGGLSDARNYGLPIAKGRYVVFCDSDDWIEPDIFEKAVENQQLNNADIVVWGYYADFVDNKENIIRTDIHQTVDVFVCRNHENKIESDSDFSGFTGYAWNKLYTRDLIESNSLTFEKGTSLVEDILFNSEAYCAAEKILYISDLGTHYIQRRRDTLGAKYYPNYFDLKMRAYEARKRIFTSYSIIFNETEFSVLRNTVMNISRTPILSVFDKKQKILDLMQQDKCKGILNNYHPFGIKNVLVYVLLKLKLYGILIGVYNIQ